MHWGENHGVKNAFVCKACNSTTPMFAPGRTRRGMELVPVLTCQHCGERRDPKSQHIHDPSWPVHRASALKPHLHPPNVKWKLRLKQGA